MRCDGSDAVMPCSGCGGHSVRRGKESLLFEGSWAWGVLWVRSWKTDVCRRKVNIVFSPFMESLDTAEVLFSVRDHIYQQNFIVIVGSVIFDPKVIEKAVEMHRARDPVLTMVVQPTSELNSPPQPLNKSLNESVTATFMAYSADHQLLYARNRSAIADSMEAGRITLKKSVLRRFPTLSVSSNFFDSQIYVFSKQALFLVEEKRRSISSIRQHLVPRLVKMQFSTLSEQNQERIKQMNVHSMAHVMSSSPQRPLSEMRCFLCEIPPSFYLGRVDTLDDFILLNRLVSDEKISFFQPAGERAIQNKTTIIRDPSATVDPQAMLGSGCVIGQGTIIAGPCSIKKTTLGRHNRVAPNVKIQGSITLHHVSIGEGAVVKNSVLGADVIIEEKAVIENAIVGFGVKTQTGQKINDVTFTK